MISRLFYILVITLSFAHCHINTSGKQEKKNPDSTSDKQKFVKTIIDSILVNRDKDILKTLDFFDIAVEITKAENFKELEAYLYFLAAGQYNLISDPENSIRLFKRSIAIYDSLDMKLQSGKANNNLAWVYGTIHNKEEELIHFKKAYNLVQAAGSDFYSAQILRNIGDCYFERDSLDLAFHTQTEALAIFEKLDNQFHKAISYRRLARIEIKKGNYSNAKEFSENSKKLLSKEKYPLEYQRTIRCLATCYIHLNKLQTAQKLNNEALKISKELRNSLDEKRELEKNYFQKMKILFRLDKNLEAEKYLHLANTYRDSLTNNQKDEVIEIFKKRYDNEKLKTELNRVKVEYQQVYLIISVFFIIVILIFLILLIISNLKKKKFNLLLQEQKHDLELLNEQFYSFFENSNRAIRVVNSKNQIILWNKAAEKLTGITKEKAIGNSFIKALNTEIKFLKGKDTNFKEVVEYIKTSPYDLKSNYADFKNSVQLKVRTNDGKIKYIFDSIFLIETSSDIYMGGMADDVTEERENEYRLIEALEKVEASNKLKTEFLAQMSHEIRTPVNTITSFLSLIQEETKQLKNDDINTSFNMIEQGSNRLIRTIDLILDMSQLQSGTFETIKREVKLVENIIQPLINEYYYKSVKKGLKLHFDNDLNTDLSIKTDVYIITQILVNLLDNAVKYTEKGSVTIKLYYTNSDLPSIDVEDTGIGMSKTFLENIFLPFSQEEQGYTRKYEGNGLGLSLVKRYCDLINAEINVESEKGKGSRFTIILKK